MAENTVGQGKEAYADWEAPKQGTETKPQDDAVAKTPRPTQERFNDIIEYQLEKKGSEEVYDLDSYKQVVSDFRELATGGKKVDPDIRRDYGREGFIQSDFVDLLKRLNEDVSDLDTLRQENIDEQEAELEEQKSLTGESEVEDLTSMEPTLMISLMAKDKTARTKIFDYYDSGPAYRRDSDEAEAKLGQLQKDLIEELDRLLLEK